MNLVAPTFRLASLPKDDPARAALETELATLGVPRATTSGLVDALKGVDHLGTLLRVDRAIAALLDDLEKDEGPLLAYGAKKQRVRLEGLVASFLDAHASESDLGLRLEGEQLAAGVRFIELAKEGRYDVVVGNPPYQGLSKTAGFEYVVKNYPRGKADLYAAFLERGLELVREGGISGLITIRGWMFLSQFAELRSALLREHALLLGDLGWGAFEMMTDNPVTMSLARRSTMMRSSCAVSPADPTARVRTDEHRRSLAAGLLAQVGRYEFEPKAFAVIDAEPVVYWWTKDFLAKYAAAPKLGDLGPARQGLATGDNTRFIRAPWEIPGRDRIGAPAWSAELRWAPYIKGAAGQEWFEPQNDLLNWSLGGAELHHFFVGGKLASRPQNADLYFQRGIAFSMIGAEFSARAHVYLSVFGHKGSSVFPTANTSLADLLCTMNCSGARFVLRSLNPGIGFEVGDVKRLPILPIKGAEEIVGTLERVFIDHESHREPSVEMRAPGPSAWPHAQAWAQRAVDRPEGAPLPAYTAAYDPSDPEAHVSFAIGVALGRFSANGEGVLDVAPKTALDAGILFVGPSDAYVDSLTQPSVKPVLAAWETFTPSSGKKPALRDWLRKDFLALLTV